MALEHTAEREESFGHLETTGDLHAAVSTPTSFAQSIKHLKRTNKSHLTARTADARKEDVVRGSGPPLYAAWCNNCSNSANRRGSVTATHNLNPSNLLNIKMTVLFWEGTGSFQLCTLPGAFLPAAAAAVAARWWW